MTFLGNTNKGFVITCRDPCDTRAFSHSLSLSVVFLFFEDRHESHDHCDEDILRRDSISLKLGVHRNTSLLA